MTEAGKQFDAVQMMRSIRDRISREIRGLSFEEERTYIHERLSRSPLAHYSVDNNTTTETSSSPAGSKMEAGF